MGSRWFAGVAFLALGLGLRAQSVELHRNWKIQSSARVSAAPAAISAPGFATAGWYSAAVPTTVFSALVADGLYPNPDFGMNLRQAAGVTYDVGVNFSHEPLAPDSPYAVPWWYRTEFTLPAGFRGKTVWLDFHGINYRANIWLNGHRIADDGQALGTFRRFEFNVTPAIRPGRNALAVEVYAPRVNDLAITDVDWNPMPPDKDMGLWQAVVLRASGPVAIRHAWVRSQVEAPAAQLTVAAELINATGVEQRGHLVGRYGAVHFARNYALAPHQRVEAVFGPSDTPGLELAHARLWWPYDMGKPVMQHLTLRFLQGSKTSDTARVNFGIDQITAQKNAAGGEQFAINGRKLFVRGGGWTSGMMLRDGPARWRLDFDYVRALNLNTVRSEGKLVDNDFFDLADRDGILVMAGWSCCDHWEEWKHWDGNELQVATASLRDQALRLRGHPSLLVWLNGSDNPPPAHVEQAYLNVLKRAGWPKPTLSSASGKPAPYSGPSGVKMSGPYDYVPPMYWQAAPQLGGARGFNTETSPGAAVPPIESLKQFIPASHLWTAAGPNDPYWTFHAGSGNFKNLARFNHAMDQRYGPPTGLRDYVWKAQAMAYEGERAMFEAYGRRQGEATGVVQWMLNNGWPSLIWHLYGYDLRPGAGFYGVKLANQPLHVQYADTDRAVSVVDHRITPASGLSVHAAVYALDGKRLYTRRAAGLSLAAQSSIDAFTLPAFPHDVFLNLEMKNARGRMVSRNFYWLSAQPDVLDLKHSTWYFTPEASTADFKPLSQLPPVQVRARARFARRGVYGAARVRVTNPTPHVAFLVRLQITAGNGGPTVLPVYWSDNYISLLPGETRNLTVRYRLKDLHGAAPALAVDGWNVKAPTDSARTPR